jgi:hypothetical protein
VWFYDGRSVSSPTVLKNDASGNTIGNGSIWTVNGTVVSSNSSPTPPTVGLTSYMKISTLGTTKCVITTPTFALPSATSGNGYTMTLWIYFNNATSGSATNSVFFQLSSGTNVSTQGTLSGALTGGLLCYVSGANGVLIDHSNLGNITFNNATYYYPFSSTTWYHIALVSRCTGVSGTIYCYVNGTLANDTTKSTGYPSGSPTVNLSMGIGACSFADLRIFNTPLIASQISDIYNGIV